MKSNFKYLKIIVFFTIILSTLLLSGKIKINEHFSFNWCIHCGINAYIHRYNFSIFKETKLENNHFYKCFKQFYSPCIQHKFRPSWSNFNTLILFDISVLASIHSDYQRPFFSSIQPAESFFIILARTDKVFVKNFMCKILQKDRENNWYRDGMKYEDNEDSKLSMALLEILADGHQEFKFFMKWWDSYLINFRKTPDYGFWRHKLHSDPKALLKSK